MIPQNNMLLAFLQELLQRFFTKSPKFFRIWQLITAIAAAITGLPELLAYFGVALPETLATFQNKFLAALSTGMFIMSALTTQSKATGVISHGQPVKTTDAKALPFTAAQEVKKVIENQPL